MELTGRIIKLEGDEPELTGLPPEFDIEDAEYAIHAILGRVAPLQERVAEIQSSPIMSDRGAASPYRQQIQRMGSMSRQLARWARPTEAAALIAEINHHLRNGKA